MANEFAYNFRYVCVCGHELETDDRVTYDQFEQRHKDCKHAENEALALLRRLVVAVETIETYGMGGDK